MTVRTNVSLAAAMFMASLAFAAAAQADTACNEKVVRDRLAAMEAAFRQPDMQAKLSSAQKDWLDNNEFDDEASAKYLGVVAAYHSIKRNFDGGSVDGACEILTRSDPMVKTVLGDP